MFEQDRVLVRLQQRVISEGDIVACFLAGSYGRRETDRNAEHDDRDPDRHRELVSEDRVDARNDCRDDIDLAIDQHGQ